MSTLKEIARSHRAEIVSMARRRSDWKTPIDKINMLQKVITENRENRRLGTRVERRLNKLPFDRIRERVRQINLN